MKSHTLSPSLSDICQQLPHQLLNVPLTSGMVKPLTPFISTWKVTLYAEGAPPQGPQDSQHTTSSVVSLETFKVLFV